MARHHPATAMLAVPLAPTVYTLGVYIGAVAGLVRGVKSAFGTTPKIAYQFTQGLIDGKPLERLHKEALHTTEMDTSEPFVFMGLLQDGLLTKLPLMRPPFRI